jgi:hypothetical protein
MFHFPRYALAYASTCRKQVGFPIRKFPGQRLIGTSPKLIAAILRPSSLLEAKASTIHPYIPVRNTVHRLNGLPIHLRGLLYTAVQLI